MSEPITGAPVVADGEAPLTSDVPCRKCGYNLRGLTASGRCPECGLEVNASLDAPGIELLDRADPRWVRTMREGIVLLMIAAAWEVAAGLAVFDWLAHIHDHRRMIAAAVANVIACFGVWKLGTPEQDERGGRLSGTVRRRSMRGGTVAWIVCLSIAQSEFRPAEAVVFLAITAVVGAAVMTFASIQHLAALAGRVPNRALQVQLIVLSIPMTLSLAWLLLIARGPHDRMNAQPPIGNVRGIVEGIQDFPMFLRFRNPESLAYLVLSPGASAWLCVLLVVMYWKLSLVLRAQPERI